MSYENYPEHKEIKKTLVIIFRHLGDVLLTSPVFSNLKIFFPDAQIDVYLYKGTEAILEGHPAISEIITYDRKIKKMGCFKKIIEEIKLLRKIRKRKYDLVLNLTEGDRGAIVAGASNAKYLVGHDNGKGIKGKGKVYTHFVKQCSTSRHRVEKNLDFIRRIGVFPEKDEKSLFFHVPEKTYENMKELLSKNNFYPKNFILIHPASRWRFKCWKNLKVNNLSKMLINKGEKIIFTAGDEDFEREMIDDIIKDLPKDKILNLSGKISLKELGALIDMSKLLFCVDSVPLHMASALKSKCLCLFGPTDERIWGPWQNDRAKIITENYPCRPCLLDGCGGSKRSECLASISEEKVLAAIDQML
jgi:heptosyltransferase III